LEFPSWQIASPVFKLETGPGRKIAIGTWNQTYGRIGIAGFWTW
jgi:hypothetical protein